MLPQKAAVKQTVVSYDRELNPKTIQVNAHDKSHSITNESVSHNQVKSRCL